MKLKFFIWIFVFPLCALSQEWEETYELSTTLSETTNKPVLLVFSGSDWCAPCIKLDRLLFQSAEFKEYAKEHLILFKADFPRKKKNRLSPQKELYNKALAQRFNPKGYFPLVLLLDEEENILGSFAYEGQEVQQYISLLNSYQK